MRYKCDKCGAPIYADPDEPRICDDCAVRMKEKEQEVPRITYAGRRETVYAGV